MPFRLILSCAPRPSLWGANSTSYWTNWPQDTSTGAATFQRPPRFRASICSRRAKPCCMWAGPEIPLDGRRVVGDVQARSEADLDDFAREPFAHAATLRVRHLHVAHDIDDPRHDVLAIGAHILLPRNACLKRETKGTAPTEHRSGWGDSPLSLRARSERQLKTAAFHTK
jgi:hypothetical protein